MPKQLTLYGRVQGVFCRAYCSQYGKKLKIHGTASNRPDGTVEVILDSDDMRLVQTYIQALLTNPSNYTFFGNIENVDCNDYHGSIRGDYAF